MTDLKGKTALVTGSTSGIGRATAIALAARGAHVLIVGRDEQRAKDVVAEIEGSGGSAAFRLTTLGDLESAQDLVEWATEAGDGHVDILINNAGVALLGPSMAATEAEFDETFALNVKVPFFLVAALAPAMAERGWGSIVNVSTMVASFGQAGMAMYGASRAALELLTKAWAAEYGPSGVRVNAVAPGPTRTRMMEAVPDEMVNQLAGLAPAGRVAQPEELAAAIVFLASDEASFVHGVTLAVDGGRVSDVSPVLPRPFKCETRNTINNQQLRSITMSAYVIVEFTVKDPDVYREKYAANAGQTATEYGAEILANSNWEVLDGAPMLSSGVIVQFPDHETALRWYNSPEYQQLIEVRGIAMDARFSLLDGLPRSTEGERESV